MTSKEILSHLPYSKPFLFVDVLETITDERVVGNYVFKADSSFYKGHFTDNPVTPGVILTECCAQIGLVCLGIHLLGKTLMKNDLSAMRIGMSSSEMEFCLPVLPGEKVTVSADKVYFRFNKLKCKVNMHNTKNELVCRGVLSGMFKLTDDAE